MQAPSQNKNLRNKKSGMTLVEALVALSIFVLIMLAVVVFQVNVFSYNRRVSGSYTTVQDAQVLLKTIIKELRTMTNGANGAYPLGNAASTTLTFYADVNNDGSVDQITYSLVGSTLYKNVIKPTGTPPLYLVANQSTTTLAYNVRNASTTLFTYYDQSYDGTTAPLAQPVTVTSVHLIKIAITLDVDPNQSPLPVTYSSEVSLRNLKTNL